MAGRDAGRRRLSTRRAYRALAQRMRQCSQQRWFQRGGASFGRCVQAAGDAQAKRTVAARACQQPGVRALRALARAFAPMLATALVSASRWWILSEAREASDGGDGPCWVIGGGGGVRRLRGRQAVASGDGGCTGWLRRAEQRCTSERQARQCEWSVRAAAREGGAGRRPQRLPAWQQRRQRQGRQRRAQWSAATMMGVGWLVQGGVDGDG